MTTDQIVGVSSIAVAATIAATAIARRIFKAGAERRRIKRKDIRPYLDDFAAATHKTIHDRLFDYRAILDEHMASLKRKRRDRMRRIYKRILPP